MNKTTTTTDMFWHNDGHKISLRINKSEIEIVETHCPHDESGACWEEGTGCLVEWYLTRYGMECNAGVCPAAETIELCWSLVGDRRNLDAAQIWFMPVSDETFAAWLFGKSQTSQ